MSELEYHVKFPKTRLNFMGNEFTFSINHVKSRFASVLYFYFRLYDDESELIYTYDSNRWVVGASYLHKEETFTVPQEKVDNALYYDLELVGIGITSENPLYFNEVMFQEGEFIDYHIPRETVESWEVKFNKNSFANLYSPNGSYLQVIRPLRDYFYIDKLTKSNCTVLAPHLYDERDIDSPVSVFLEFINQTEQTIGLLR